MESNATDGPSPAIEQKFRELNLEKSNMQSLELPKTGNESSVKVTKSEDDLDLGGSLKDQRNLSQWMKIVKNRNPPPSVDIVEDTGIDCTREPDWQVVKSDNFLKNLNLTKCIMISTGMREV